MAQARVAEAPVTEDVQEQLHVIENLRASVTTDKSQDLAHNALTIWGVLNVLRKEPGKTDPEWKVYDAAVRTLGRNDKDKAVTELNNALVEAIAKLNLKVKSKDDVRKDDIPQLESLLEDILAGAPDRSMREIYGAFWLISNEVGGLLESIRREKPPTADEAKALTEHFEETEIGTGRPKEASRAPARTRFEVGRVHWISQKGDVQAFSVGGELSGEQLSIFGGDSDAGNRYVGAVGNALASWREGEAQDIGCDALLDALEGITNPQVLNNAHLQNAIELLRNGQRDAALDELRNAELGPLFNSIFETANNLVIARLDNKAVRLFTAEATVIWELDDMKKFRSWLSSYDEKYPGSATVYLALTASLEFLYLGGFLEKEKLDLETGKFVPTGEPRKKVEAGGLAASLTPEWGIATGIKGIPMEFTLHCNFGYRELELKEPLKVRTQSGAIKEEKVKYQSAYIGIWGAELKLPGFEGRTNPIRLERIGVGAVGYPYNAFAYVTVSGAYKRTASMWVGTLVTPFFQGFLAEASRYTPSKYKPMPGLEIEPVNFMKEFAKGQKLSVSPGVRLQYNTADQVFTIDSYLGARWKFASAWEVGGEFGYIRDEPAGAPEAIWPSFYGRLGVRWTPGAGERVEVPAIAKAIPKKVEERESPMARAVKEAKAFAEKATEKQMTGKKGQEMARKLAGSVEGSVIMSGDMWVRDIPEYQEAIRLLQAGDLRAGLKELSKVI